MADTATKDGVVLRFAVFTLRAVVGIQQREREGGEREKERERERERERQRDLGKRQ